jgi:sigma-B regulation protein RsbU (phosphoserine phosphatase)
MAGWGLAFSWRAARQVAGDFYDCFLLPSRQLGMVIADVADKGMPAALFMALTRTLMRAVALEETSPAAALFRVNNLLVPDAQSGMFVTAFYAVLALDTGQLTYANAGHNLPLWLQSNNGYAGEIMPLRKGGMALGVLENVPYEEHTITLLPGDCLILYTDGITEAFSATNVAYGIHRLQAAIQDGPHDSAQSLLEAIDSSVVRFIGGAPLSDDRTLMILHRK